MYNIHVVKRFRAHCGFYAIENKLLLLLLLATTRNPCVALQRQLSIGNYEVAFVHFINHWL